MVRWIALPFIAGVLGLGSYFVFFRETSEAGGDLYGYGRIELAIKSDYSTIRVRKMNNTRTLSFIRDSGEEVVESAVNLDRPQDLLVPYTRFMFTSYIFRPKQEKVLIVGLGGGAMVHFIKHHDPGVKTDVVEIDPAIVRIADKYFNVRSGATVNVITEDAFKYLANTPERYDVIYMDAFLKPSRDTDNTGVPLRLKTIRFYKDIQAKLKPDGLVVFNINPHPMIRDDIKNIRDAFPQTYIFELPNDSGYVVVGAMSQERLQPPAIYRAATDLDRRIQANFSFRDMARKLVQ